MKRASLLPVLFFLVLVLFGLFLLMPREPAVAPTEASASDQQVSASPVAVSEAPEEVRAVEVPIAPPSAEAQPGAIGGRLFHMDGSPGAGIEVLAQLLPPDNAGLVGKDMAEPVLAQADERGVFHIDNLPLGNYAVHAESEGRIARDACRLNRESPVADLLLILRDSAGIAGRVVDPAGAGVPGATIYPLLQDGQERQAADVMAEATIADDAGGFALPWLDSGSWTLQVRAQGFAPTMSASIASGTDDAVIQMEPGVPLSGRTVEGGAPAPEVKVTLAQVGLNAPEVAVLSDAEGAFIFDAVGPGDYEIRGAKADLIVKDAPIQIAVASKPQSDLVLELVPGGVVRGRVTDGDSGEGIPGVVIRALLEGGGRLRRPAEPSDSEGRFEITGLNPGNYELLIHEAPGYPRYRRGERAVKVNIAPGEILEGVSIVLARGVVLSGHVVDTEGKLVAGVDVHGRIRGWQDRQFTGKDGAFTLCGLIGGERIRVLASTTSASSPEYEFDIPPTGLHDVELVLERAMDGLIAGVVVDRRGQPFRGRVSLAMADEGSHRTTHRANTDAGGRFLFANVAAGDYKIGASPADGLGRELFRLAMKPGQQVRDLRLVFDEEASLEIAGKVTDESGAPLDAILWLDRLNYPGSSAQSTGSTAVDGTFRFEGLSEGFFRIRASARGFSEVAVDDIASGTKDVSIVLPASPSISGYVVTSENEPITTFEVTAIETGAPVALTSLIRSPFKQFSNPDGSYRLEVEAGRYDVVARAPGYAMGRTRIGQVGTDSPAEDVVVVLSARASIQGCVVDAAGKPVVGAAVFLGGMPQSPERQSSYADTATGPDGCFEIGAPEAERGLHLSVYHRDAGVAEVRSEEIPTEVLEIRLAPEEAEHETDAEGGE